MEEAEFDPTRNEEKNFAEQPSPSKELLVMTVEIGDGRQDTIAIHEQDQSEAPGRSTKLKQSTHNKAVDR